MTLADAVGLSVGLAALVLLACILITLLGSHRDLKAIREMIYAFYYEKCRRDLRDVDVEFPNKREEEQRTGR